MRELSGRSESAQTRRADQAHADGYKGNKFATSNRGNRDKSEN